jgi:hypothetical protein
MKGNGKFKNGLIWTVREMTNTPEVVAARQRRDRELGMIPFPGDQRTYELCDAAITSVRILVETNRHADEIKAAATGATSNIVAGCRREPGTAPWYADLLETLADTLSERRDTEFCSVETLISLAALWDQDGETPAAKLLLELLISQLKRPRSPRSKSQGNARGLAVAHCAFAALLRSESERPQRLIAVRRALEASDAAHDRIVLFVLSQYRLALEAQHGPMEAIQTFRLLEEVFQQSPTSSGEDWLVEWLTSLHPLMEQNDDDFGRLPLLA